MTDDRALSALMREGMAAEARQVSADAALAERIIAGATRTQDAPDPIELPGRAWRNWVLPAVAAVLVALLASSVFLGTRLVHSSHTHPAGSHQPSPTMSGPTAPAPTRTAPSPTPSNSPSAVPVGPVGGPVPSGFRATDLTWVSLDDGWALGTAPCANAPCTSIVRTTNGGASWFGIPAPRAELFGLHDCSTNCVSSLRFANSLVGYAFGPGALYLTTDGGATWARQSGGAAALEIADSTVLRVQTQCTPGCPYTVQRSAVGSTNWTSVALPVPGQTAGAELVRSGREAALLTKGHVAGGAQNATSVLYTSGNDGASWISRGEPCQQTGAEVDSRAVASAADGSLTVLCTPRQSGGAQFTMTSTDGGAHFAAAPASLGSVPPNALGTASRSTLLVSLDRLYRSTDGGRTWHPVSNGPASASLIGFESASVGRVLPASGTGTTSSGTPLSDTVWTTTDAGSTWHAYTFK